MRADRDRLDNLEPFICDVGDMADVTVVVLNHHRTQVISVAGAGMTGEQAIKALDHTAKLVDFCAYQLSAMAVSLRQQYYADEVEP